MALARALGRAKERGITVIAITQRPALLRSVDKILVLRNGAVEALGPRDEILRRLSTTKPVAPRPDQGGKPQGQGRNDKRPDSGPQPGE